jgi:hypothetical protein
VAQFVLIVVLFLNNKKLRAEVHNKTFEILLKDNLITGDEYNLINQER